MRLVAGLEGILFAEAFAADGAVALAKPCEPGLEASCRSARAASIAARRAALAEDEARL